MNASHVLHSTVTGAGAPVLVLHGLFGSSTNWRSVCTRLATQFEVHAIDLPNHGESPWTDTMDYPGMAESMEAYIGRRTSPPVNVIGHSMGGKVAMELALTRPDLLRALVAVDIAPCDYPPPHDGILEALSSVDPGTASSRGEVETALATFLRDRSVVRFLLTNLKRRDTGGYRWKINLPAISRSYPALLDDVARGRSSFVRTLFVAGGRSGYIGERERRAIAGAFPRARIVTIDGAAHWVHADAPDEFLAVVTGFLSEDRWVET